MNKGGLINRSARGRWPTSVFGSSLAFPTVFSLRNSFSLFSDRFFADYLLSCCSSEGILLILDCLWRLRAQGPWIKKWLVAAQNWILHDLGPIFCRSKIHQKSASSRNLPKSTKTVPRAPKEVFWLHFELILAPILIIFETFSGTGHFSRMSTPSTREHRK